MHCRIGRFTFNIGKGNQMDGTTNKETVPAKGVTLSPEHASKLQTFFDNADAILAAAAKYEQLAKFLSSEFSHFKL
jgi:hypothetical protein